MICTNCRTQIKDPSAPCPVCEFVNKKAEKIEDKEDEEWPKIYTDIWSFLEYIGISMTILFMSIAILKWLMTR